MPPFWTAIVMKAGSWRFGDGEVVDCVANEIHPVRAVMDDEERGFGAVFVGGGDVDENFAFLADWFPVGLEGFVVALEDFAFGKRHGEFEVTAVRIAFVGEVGVKFVFRTDGEAAVAFGAGILGVFV